MDPGAYLGHVPLHAPTDESSHLERVRFSLDEHLSPRIAEIARGLGIDVTSVTESGTTEHDGEALDYAILYLARAPDV